MNIETIALIIETKVKHRLDTTSVTSKFMDTPCWIWLGAKDSQGYGRVRYETLILKIHRLMFQLAINTIIGNDIHILHNCGNKACCRPQHLYPGTHLDNAHDRIRRGEWTSQKGAKSPNAILTEDQARAIKNDPRHNDIIAKEYGVSRPTVSRIKHGHSWKHI